MAETKYALAGSPLKKEQWLNNRQIDQVNREVQNLQLEDRLLESEEQQSEMQMTKLNWVKNKDVDTGKFVSVRF